jgi:hypothetical protein
MGADLIGYIVVGPEKLKPTSRQLALAKRVAEDLLEMVSEAAESEDYAALETKYASSLKYAAYGDFPEDFTCVSGLKADQVIADLFEVWGGGGRDVMYRTLHFDHMKNKLRKPMRIVTAGELSWGDEPDGFGYVTLRNADRLGILSIFHIG